MSKDIHLFDEKKVCNMLQIISLVLERSMPHISVQIQGFSSTKNKSPDLYTFFYLLIWSFKSLQQTYTSEYFLTLKETPLVFASWWDQPPHFKVVIF